MPADVRIRFAGQRPILVEFRNGRLELTLRFALFTQPGRIELTDFVVRTSYIPRVDTLDADLIHEGAPSIDGDRISFRERLPLRAIFGKIFASRATIPLMNATLKMTHAPRAWPSRKLFWNKVGWPSLSVKKPRLTLPSSAIEAWLASQGYRIDRPARFSKLRETLPR